MRFINFHATILLIVLNMRESQYDHDNDSRFRILKSRDKSLKSQGFDQVIDEDGTKSNI